MWRSLKWECDGESITFSDEHRAAVFMDFGAFQSGAASGVYDRRSSPGIDGTVTYAASSPTRGRGLKLACLVAFWRYWGVVPHAGAWIEI